LDDSPPVLVCDLLISTGTSFILSLLIMATVRENMLSDMRFTFEVISPGQRIYTLQVCPLCLSACLLLCFNLSAYGRVRVNQIPKIGSLLFEIRLRSSWLCSVHLIHREMMTETQLLRSMILMACTKYSYTSPLTLLSSHDLHV
jgi:hypothetical protein